MTSDQDKSHFS